MNFVTMFSANMGEHTVYIGIVFRKLHDAGDKLNASKGSYAVDTLDFLGNGISVKGVKLDLRDGSLVALLRNESSKERH